MQRTRLWPKHPLYWSVVALLLSLPGVASRAAESVATHSPDKIPGKAAYRYYCYQCHGYSGDAKTLASSYLDPKPRDFTSHTITTLPIERMIDAVKNGRPDTAMVSFSTVLSNSDIVEVVEYVRKSFMSGAPLNEKYHSVENGWVNHERYASAFPFIEGTIAINSPWETLDTTQQHGKQLYLSACVSCHDQANTDAPETVWELRAVSIPRKHYSHKYPPLDFVSGASPYATHDTPATPPGLSQQQARGMSLYQDNCAFCHAPDGTGKNWIGSFLEPRPRDFTDSAFALLGTPEALREVIKGGIPESSMPAWRAVLADEQIDDIIAYMQAAFGTD